MITLLTKGSTNFLLKCTRFKAHTIIRILTSLSLGKAILFTSFLVAGGVIGVKQTGILQFLELATFDQFVRLQPDKEPDSRLLVVGITEADIRSQNQWPISDQILAKALASLQRYHPKVIALDLYRNVPQPPGHEALVRQLKQSNVIVIKQIGDSTTEAVPALAGIPANQIGFNDLVVDPDGVIRRNFMYAEDEGEKYYSFALRASLKYLEPGMTLQVRENALQIGQATFPRLQPDSGGYQTIDSAGYQVAAQYRSAERVSRQITFNQVLNGTFDPSWVAGKVVLIGTTAPSIKDFHQSPYSAVKQDNPGTSGILIHAQFVSQILGTVLDRQTLFWFWDSWWEGLWIFGWAIVGGLIVWRIQNPFLQGVAGFAALGGLSGICFIVFTHAGWVSFVSPTIALVATGVSALAYKLLHNTLYDELTHLPNRRLLLQRIQQAIVHNNCLQSETLSADISSFAVLFLGLDRFKVINEGWGHQVGDQLLIDVAKRLKKKMPKAGFSARVGGDEFAVLLEDIRDRQDVTKLVDNLQQECANAFHLDGKEVFISFSIGITLSQVGQDYKPENLLRDAHTAMYRAKDLGKARYEVFSAGMHAQVVEKLWLENDLRQAIMRIGGIGAKQELFLQYQPIISLESKSITGFEALVRWNHPQYGSVPPLKFVLVAEENGLIIPLSQWILQEACRQLQSWQAMFSEAHSLTMSVNLSGQQLTQPDLVEFVERTLKTTKLDGRNLKLEITETVAMKDVEATINILLRLRALNLRLSIDDFGTGYSSLSYLHRFPITTLKVDRSFVTRMLESDEDAAIVQTIIVLGHKLGMDIIAEGIETAEQASSLQSLGCEYGQGYFFSKPLSVESATEFLRSAP